jgi:hypothetical protein
MTMGKKVLFFFFTFLMAVPVFAGPPAKSAREILQSIREAFETIGSRSVFNREELTAARDGVYLALQDKPGVKQKLGTILIPASKDRSFSGKLINFEIPGFRFSSGQQVKLGENFEIIASSQGKIRAPYQIRDVHSQITYELQQAGAGFEIRKSREVFIIDKNIIDVQRQSNGSLSIKNGFTTSFTPEKGVINKFDVMSEGQRIQLIYDDGRLESLVLNRQSGKYEPKSSYIKMADDSHSPLKAEVHELKARQSISESTNHLETSTSGQK